VPLIVRGDHRRSAETCWVGNDRTASGCQMSSTSAKAFLPAVSAQGEGHWTAPALRGRNEARARTLLVRELRPHRNDLWYG